MYCEAKSDIVMTYIIGEIGQNHNGSVDIAKLLIELIAKPVRDDLFDLELKNMDAVKLTKRNLKEELTNSQMAAPYNSPHSFGKTYGEHREVLELSDEEHFEVYKSATEAGLDFVETICSIGAMSLLKLFQPKYLKVASRDLTNLPLLNALAETKIPMILSTGMGGKMELDDAIGIITRHHNALSILHCVSEYPTHPDNANLNTIDYLKENYGQFVIGYSDHTIGISAAVAAVAKGAEIVEKHITINRDMKGTDQRGSLGPEGTRRMVRDIRLLERYLGKHDIFTSPSVTGARTKLERSIATNKNLEKGHVILEEDIHLLSPGDGFKWAEKGTVVGRKLNANVSENELIYPKHLEA